jgi:hypothetical protein
MASRAHGHLGTEGLVGVVALGQLYSGKNATYDLYDDAGDG